LSSVLPGRFVSYFVVTISTIFEELQKDFNNYQFTMKED